MIPNSRTRVQRVDSQYATFIVASYRGETNVTHDWACRVLQQQTKITREPGLTDTLHAFSK